MNLVTIIALAIGVIVGGLSCACMVQRQWRRVHRETAQKIESSCDIQDNFYATADMAYRITLQKLESGDTEGAKLELSSAIANFYHHFKQLDEHSRWIAAEVREVELQAKSSAVLADALKKKPRLFENRL